MRLSDVLVESTGLEHYPRRFHVISRDEKNTKIVRAKRLGDLSKPVRTLLNIVG